MIDPHASAIRQDKQILAQQAWDKKYGKPEAARSVAEALLEGSKDRRRAVLRNRVARGEDMGEKLLQEFAGEPWADEALAKLGKPAPAENESSSTHQDAREGP